MNNKITTGIWLLFIGSIVLLHNLHIIDFNYFAAFRLWPLLLVSVGISFLFQNRSFGTYVIAASNIIICSIIFYQGTTSKASLFDGINIVSNNDAEFIPANSAGVLYQLDGDRVNLKINGGAAKYIMNSKISEDSLFRASTDSPSSSISVKSEGEGNNDLTLSTQVKSNRSGKNLINVGLNPKPIWDLEYNIGAASISADFKDLRIGSFVVNSGATSMEIYLPGPIDLDNLIEINTAASSIKLYLPKGAPCKVETDAILSSNKYEDVDVVQDEFRKTANYDQSDKRYNIKVEGAANSLTILRY